LFGDIGPARGRDGKPGASDDGADAGFAATAILETVATEVNARGQMVDRHSHDIVVTGSPAQAIREHFAATRSDLDTATSLITLLDPVGLWAPAVIKALSDAGGRPIERLHLREHTTLRTLATIERTTLVRRHEDTLRIYHADVRAAGSENAEIPIALMERSQMTTVVIGPLQPHAIDGLLAALHSAAMLPTWRCPNLLFMLPPNAVWITNKISAIAWPARLHVHMVSESMSSASAVWNAMLGMWNQVKAQPGWAPDSNPTLTGVNDFPIKVRDLGEWSHPAPTSARSTGNGGTLLSVPASVPGAALPDPTAAAQAMRVGRPALDPARARLALAGMLVLEGLLGCAVVDATTGLALARETRGDVDLDLSAAACTQLLRAHRQAARSMGMVEQVDELIISAGSRQQVIRTVSHQPELFLVVLLDKQRTNLALARYQLMELERSLV
jgi:predicted regulator of Ras-like GTPase activity (Roadblock/LC7/MglB family)